MRPLIQGKHIVALALIAGASFMGPSPIALAQSEPDSEDAKATDEANSEDEDAPARKTATKKKARKRDAPMPLLANLSEPYIEQNEIVERVRRSGMDSQAWELLEEPETPFALRAAIIDAAARSGRIERMPEIYVRRMRRYHSGKLTLDRLKTFELFTLGYLIARYDPVKLAPLGGSSEVEKSSPLLLLSAASNRNRGDMAIKLALGLVKANQAVTSPEDALCEPQECIDQALQYYTTEWSVHPTAVCNAVATVDQHVPEKTRFKSRDICQKVATKHTDAPRYAAHAIREQTSPGKMIQASTAQPHQGGFNPQQASRYQAYQQQLMLIDHTMAEVQKIVRDRSRPSSERFLAYQALRELSNQRRIILGAMQSMQNQATAPSQSPASPSTVVIPSISLGPSPTSPSTQPSNTPQPSINALPIQSGSSPGADGNSVIEFDDGRSGTAREFTLPEGDDTQEDTDGDGEADGKTSRGKKNSKEVSLD